MKPPFINKLIREASQFFPFTHNFYWGVTFSLAPLLDVLGGCVMGVKTLVKGGVSTLLNFVSWWCGKTLPTYPKSTIAN